MTKNELMNIKAHIENNIGYLTPAEVLGYYFFLILKLILAIWLIT